MSVRVATGMSAVDPAGWDALSARHRLVTSHAYLRFREHVEPGAPVAATVADGSGVPYGGLHGVVTTDATALFSHPWKMLAGDQFLRLDDEPADSLLRERAALIGSLAGVPDDGRPLWTVLTEALGDVLVVRGFDASEVLVRPGADRAGTTAMLLAAAQDVVRAGSAGAVALPFVDPGDEPLRAALAEAGFRSGVLTAMTSLDLPSLPTFDAYVATLPKRLRRRFRLEANQLDEAGLILSTARLPDVLGRVVELEAATTTAHGGSPDLTRLTAARTAMDEILGDAVQTLVVRRDDHVVACGIDLVDEHTYHALLYGCDYAEEHRATAYQCVCFHGPLRYALEHGLGQMRFGFEAFVPKLIRGAVLGPRETWIWLPDADRRPALARLLDLLDGRTRGHLARLPVHRS